MPTPVFTGSALATYDLWTATLGGTFEADDVLLFTIGDKTFSMVAGSTTITDIIDDIVENWNALDETLYPEFAEYTAAVGSSTTVTFTAEDPGIPGTISVNTTETGGGAADTQTFTITNTTAATGPNFWSNADNWSTGAVPVNGDSVYFENSDVDVLYGLAQSAVTVTLLQIAKSYTGKIGLPRTNDNGGYIDYRPTYLAIGATTCTIGQGDGGGSGRIKINFGSVQTALSVLGSGSPLENGIESIIVKGTHADNTLTATEGSLGSGIFATETATWKTNKIGYESNQASDVQIRFGSGCTLNGGGATLVQSGGNLVAEAGLAEIKRTGGTMTVRGSAAVATLYNRGGTYFHESTGTITACHNSAIFDRTRFIGAGTVTDMTLYRDSTTLDPNGTLTWTNPVQLYECDVEDLKELRLGKHRKLTVANI